MLADRQHVDSWPKVSTLLGSCKDLSRVDLTLVHDPMEGQHLPYTYIPARQTSITTSSLCAASNIEQKQQRSQRVLAPSN